LSAAIYFGASLVYIFFASAKLQSWGISHSENVDSNENAEKEFDNKMSKARNTNNNNPNNKAFVSD
jgi:hypothetical protein